MDELKKRIRRSGYTQLQIAERIGVKPSTLASYLNRYNPMPESIKADIEKLLMEEQL